MMKKANWKNPERGIDIIALMFLMISYHFQIEYFIIGFDLIPTVKFDVLPLIVKYDNH